MKRRWQLGAVALIALLLMLGLRRVQVAVHDDPSPGAGSVPRDGMPAVIEVPSLRAMAEPPATDAPFAIAEVTVEPSSVCRGCSSKMNRSTRPIRSKRAVLRPP